MAQSIVVYGPKGCGKTRNARRLMRALGMRQVVDDWSFYAKTAPRENALLLTHEDPPEQYKGPTLSYGEAIRKAATRTHSPG